VTWAAGSKAAAPVFFAQCFVLQDVCETFLETRFGMNVWV
jgi:hypothetical protein